MQAGLSVFCGMNRDVADSNSWSEAATLVQTMDTRIFPATLHQDMMAALRPGHSQRGPDDRPAMPLPAKLGMRDDILEERVRRLGAIMSMQVAAMVFPAWETKTATPS